VLFGLVHTLIVNRAKLVTAVGDSAKSVIAKITVF